MAFLYVSSFNTGSIKQYDGTSGAYVTDYVQPGDGGLTNPTGLIFDAAGNLYVADSANNNVLLFNPGGLFNKVFATGNGLSKPQGLAFDANGLLYIANVGGSNILT